MKEAVIFCAGEFEALWEPVGENAAVFAADGGLAHVERLGLTPDVILGDFDSLGYIPQNSQVFPVEKDDTDAMLAVKKAIELGFEAVTIYGGLDGQRLDHTLANYQTLQYAADHGLRARLLGHRYGAAVVKNGTLHLPARREGIVSVFCMGADAKSVSIKGLHYELENGVLTAGFPLGVSNHFVGKSVEISAKDGSLLILWEKE